MAAREKESGWTDWRDHDKAEKYIKQRERKAVLEKEAFERAEARRPVSAELVSTEYRQSTLRAFGRAVVGDWLGGFLGSVLGAATTPGKEWATFRVRYATGRIGTETVEVGGKRFRQLSALCD